MKSIYFISDIHLSFNLSEAEKKKRGRLYAFLDFLHEDAEQLFILGDLFDFWFEWVHVIPKYWFPVLYRFKRMIQHGIKINMVWGNHDFFLGEYLEKEIGIRSLGESHEFSLDNKRFFIAHGDGLAKQDRGYRLLKKIIRSPVSIFLYRTLIPADLGIQLAKWTSQSSRKLVNKKKQAWSEEYYQFARNKFSNGIDDVILGHLHVPVIRKDGQKIYINCGDWLSEFTFARYRNHKLSLQHWTENKVNHSKLEIQDNLFPR
jgi:UDP-2,3-diacylglucosamine hydrolase